MKYLFDLLQKEKYKEVISFCAIGIVGILLVVNFLIQFKEFAIVTFNPLDGTNIWIPLLGIILIYIGFFYLPSVNGFVTNKEDYIIEELEENNAIHVRYQDYSFSLLKEGKLKRMAFYGEDEQGKKVSYLLACRIYAGLICHHYKTISDIKEGKNVVDHYIENINQEEKYGTREATIEEIEKYRKSKKFPSSRVTIFIIAIAVILHFIYGYLEKNSDYISDILQILFFITIVPCEIIGLSMGIISIHTNQYQRYIKFGKVYIGDCYIIERKKRKSRYHYIYCAKVKNVLKGYESHWIDIDDDIYYSQDEKYKIIIIKYKNKTKLDVRREQDFE